jgi:protein-S-isoprenylcysteine O-methyltransferase Ste14
MSPEFSNDKTSTGIALPRWAIPLVWAGIVLVIQILLPLVVAQIGHRFGWSNLSPGVWNYIGLIVAGAGLSLYAWCLMNHFRSYRTSVRVGFDPPHLVVAGPYAISRNPMYLSGLLTWLGWTIYFGSPSVFIALLLLWSIFAFRIIPHEERQLEQLFGEKYLEYKRTVRRWFGRY